MIAVIPADASASTGWQVFQTFSNPRSAVTAETATSATDAWAVGMTAEEGSSPNAPLAWHWDGTTWTSIPVPSSLSSLQWVSNVLVAATSANDMWMAIDVTSPYPTPDTAYLLHWNGTTWNSVVQLPNEPVINSIVPVNATDYWVFGQDHAGIARWNFIRSSGWTRQASPDAVRETASAFASTVWTVGYDPSLKSTLVQRLSGGTWQTMTVPVTLPVPTDTTAPVGVQVDGADNVWVFECVDTPGACATTAIMHYNGSSWSRVYAPFKTGGAFGAVITDDGNGGFWISDYIFANQLSEFAYHTGQWNLSSYPNVHLGWNAMAWIPGGQSVWAGGFAGSGDPWYAAVFKYGP